jgi:signal transduction histidine kinase
MPRQLINFIEERTRILAAMSHDLKTPITRLRLRAELLEDAGARARIEGDLNEMQQMVSCTLEVMRGPERESRRIPTDMMALLHSVQDDMRVLGAEIAIEGTAATSYCATRPKAVSRPCSRCRATLVELAREVPAVSQVT